MTRRGFARILRVGVPSIRVIVLIFVRRTSCTDRALEIMLHWTSVNSSKELPERHSFQRRGREPFVYAFCQYAPSGNRRFMSSEINDRQTFFVLRETKYSTSCPWPPYLIEYAVFHDKGTPVRRKRRRAE